MPAVQTAFGPIVEPGWPDLKGPDMGAKFLSGAYIMGNINAKRRELENKLAALSLKAQSDEADRSLDNKRYQLAVDRLVTANEFKDQALDIQRRGADARDATVQLAVDKWTSRNEGDQAMIDAIQSVRDDGIDYTNPQFPDVFTQRLTAASAHGDPRKYRSYMQTHIGDFNINANRQQDLLKKQKEDFLQKMGSELYGDPSLHFTDPIEHPDLYPEETEGGVSWWEKMLPGPYQRQGVKEGPTGYRTGSITLPTGETKEVKFKTTDLTRLNKEWKALQGREQDTPKPVTIPSVGVYPTPANSPRERAERILADPDSDPQKRAAAQFWLEQHP